MEIQNNNWEKWIPILEKKVEKGLLTADLDNCIGHEMDHMRRVWDACLHLGNLLKADLEILVVAAYLHDLGTFQKVSHRHGPLSAKLAEPVLEEMQFPVEKRAKILHAIRVHDTTFSVKDRNTLESQILYDADKSESFGVIGVLRYILILYPQQPIDFILKNLKKRWNGLCLPETRIFKKSDYEYTRNYFQELKHARNLAGVPEANP